MKPTYVRAGVSLYLGNCFEIMQGLPDKLFDHTLADPPYDERTHKGAVTEGAIIPQNDLAREFGIDEFAHLVEIDLLVPELLRLTKRWNVCFCTFEDMKKYRDPAWEVAAWVRAGVWDRINPAPQFTGDRPSQACDGLAIFHSADVKKRWNGGGKTGIWRQSVETGKKVHPTQKPLALMLKLVQDFTDPDDLIFDPFMGSGTTGVAALQLGRRFVGIESKPAYFEMAVKRIEATLKQPTLFVLPSKNGQQQQAAMPL